MAKRELEIKLKIGMLWYDADSKSSIEKKVERAVKYYKQKYNTEPNKCYVKSIKEPIMVGDVSVQAMKTILPNHFWIGIEK